jgi:hypothetical protein
MQQISGVKVKIEYVPEAETIRALRYLQALLESSDWGVVGNPTPNLNLSDGVRIESSLSSEAIGKPRPLLIKPAPVDAKSREAATTLFIFLKANNWDVELVDPSKWPPSNDVVLQREMLIPPDTISVTLGLKSSPYFDPDWQKRMKRPLTADEESKIKSVRDRIQEIEQKVGGVPVRP